MEKQKFEEGWKNAFHGTEVTPSDSVWTNIELDLEKEEATGMKQKLLFYKTLAAASVIFALAFGGTGIYLFQINQFPNRQAGANVSTQDILINPRTGSSSNDDVKFSDQLKSSDDAGKVASSTDLPLEGNDSSLSFKTSAAEEVKNNANTADITGHSSDQGKMISLVDGAEKSSQQEHQFDLMQRSLPSLVDIAQPAFKLPIVQKKAEVDPVVAMMAKLAARENEIKETLEKDDTKKEHQKGFWTSVGLAAGSFDASDATIRQPLASASFNGSPGQPSAPGSTTYKASNNTSAINEARASGFSYSVGLNVGKKLSRKVLIHGGVNYLTQVSNYTAETAVTERSFTSFRPEVLNDQNSSNSGDFQYSDSRIVSTAPHKVSNNMRYLSVPVQAGYLLLDGKVGFQLNAGISTDLFLQYTKSADAQIVNGQDFEKVDADRDDVDSPYRPVNFSGLFGTELIYKVGDRYRISLNPGLRYPLSSVYKSNLGIQSTPITFDVGLRFRYIFH